MGYMIFADKKQLREGIQSKVFINVFFDITDQIPVEILFAFSISFRMQAFVVCSVQLYQQIIDS